MEDFLRTYFIFLVIGLIGLVLFWGTVIYFIIKFFKSDSGLSKKQKLDIVTRGMQAYSGRGGGAGDIMDSEVGSVAASEGIDLNDKRL